MKVNVTLQVTLPDSWTKDRDLTTSDNIIAMLKVTGVLEEITSAEDKVISAEIV